MYEAAVLALVEFRRGGFAEATFGPATRLTIRVMQPETEHTVSVGKLQTHNRPVREQRVGAESNLGVADNAGVEPAVRRSSWIKCYRRSQAPNARSELAEIGSGWIVDDNEPPIRQGLDGMAHIAGHDRNQSWLCDLGHTIDGYF